METPALPDVSSIKTDKLRTPWQLIGPLLTAAIICAWGLMWGGSRLSQGAHAWLCPVLALAGAVCAVGGLVASFILLTKYRPQLLGDEHYATYIDKKEAAFRGFAADVRQQDSAPSSVAIVGPQSWDEREDERRAAYEAQRGLFLVHSTRPSSVPGQTVDILLRLHQHGPGPLAEGTVKSVEYHLGPKFSKRTITKDNPSDGFALGISAYGPLLCLARVHFDDGSNPLELQRYVNIDL